MPKTNRSAIGNEAVIGLDLGGTKLSSALFDADGLIVVRRKLAIENRRGDAVGELIVSQVRRLLETARQRNLAVSAVGICVPGIVRPQSGRVWAPNIPGWDDYPLKAEIKATVSKQAVRVVVESDRAASILGEAWQGAARDCRNAIFLAVGTGIGAGILVDGRVLQGARGIGGAIGWMALSRPFRPEYAECGCFESHASGHGLAKMARDAVSRHSHYRGPLRSDSPITAQHVFAAYDDGDAVATEVLDDAVKYWGTGCANLISLFNPERIVFGGGMFGPATRFIDRIAAEAKRWAQPVAFQHVEFLAAQLDGDSALYGAAYLGRRTAAKSK